MAMTVKQFLLLKLIEECAEVAHRASKQMQYGGEQSQAGDHVYMNEEGGRIATKEMRQSNAERLKGELQDLFGVVRLLQDIGEVSYIQYEEFEKAFALKRQKIKKYLSYSQELGLVEKEDMDVFD